MAVTGPDLDFVLGLLALSLPLPVTVPLGALLVFL